MCYWRVLSEAGEDGHDFKWQSSRGEGLLQVEKAGDPGRRGLTKIASEFQQVPGQNRHLLGLPMLDP